jgi:hypothetical protein
VGLHRLLIQINLDLQDLAAIGGRHCRPRDGGKLRADEILPVIEQLHLRELLARERKLQNRHGCGVVAEDVRRRDARRQKLQDRLRGRGHLGERRADVYALLEENLDDAVSTERLGLDVLDVPDLRCQCAFVVIDDATGHVVRQKSRIRPNDADDRNVDVWKDVRRRAQCRERAEDRNKKREHDKSIRPPQCDQDDPHAG